MGVRVRGEVKGGLIGYVVSGVRGCIIRVYQQEDQPVRRR